MNHSPLPGTGLPAQLGLRAGPAPVTPPDSPVPRPAAFVEQVAMWIGHRPWLAAITVVLVVAWVVGQVAVARWRHTHHSRGAYEVTIAPPPEVDPAGAYALWANLAGTLVPSWRRRLVYGCPHVVWQYRWHGRQLSIGLWVPGTVPVAAVEAAIRGAWPGATLSRRPATAPLPVDAPVVDGGQLLPASAEWLPFATDHASDPLRAVLAAGGGLRDDEHACVQILTRPARPRRRRRAYRAAARLRDGHAATPGLDQGAPVRWLLDAVGSSRPHHTGARPQRRAPVRGP